MFLSLQLKRDISGLRCEAIIRATNVDIKVLYICVRMCYTYMHKHTSHICILFKDGLLRFFLEDKGKFSITTALLIECTEEIRDP